ncbi:ATP phosphoribosyltransferase regulatory subunit [uncultured Sphaerotilus sp.]|uniref:ATP phosphoribosyltransferase regulatory subunit n=1 Tax=uncultured Sphaerotilus sp. TaxID=474984 RepID=UPI0030CA341E
MSSAWLLPEHIADVLPHEARRIEELRRILLDAARGYGYELVMPPLLEHLESLLSGTGRALDLRTFKLVDQLSGRTLGVRADTTPQVARIDAHLLNRAGLTRLCYCGPVLHTLPAGPDSTREPLQFGAEIYGHGGLEADLEVHELALECLGRARVESLVMDLADARFVQGALEGVTLSPVQGDALRAALAAKDQAELQALTADLPAMNRDALRLLPSLFGGDEVLELARARLPNNALVTAALDDVQWLATHLRRDYPSLRLGFDLADLSGYAYYSGTRFAIYSAGGTDALVRGGRYDNVGAVFGRRRAAVGFSLDLKSVVEHVRFDGRRAAIRAPWSEDTALRAAVRRLRETGEAVVCVLPGHEHEADEFECDRELVAVNGQWVVCAR